MRRNDFFKYLLLNGGSQSDKAELESETLPYAFKSNGGRLRNYRIYGNTGGVGDFDSETDKYIIPVTMYGQTENLVSEIITGKYYNGSSEVTNANMATSDFIEIEPNTKYTSAHFDNSGNYTGALVFCTWTSDKVFIEQTTNAETITTESNAKYITVRNFASNSVDIKGTNFCLVRGDVRPTYVSQTYFLPKTYSISVDEPLTENQYIDFREQKNSDGDIVLMPALSTANGKNIISVETETQPSKVYIQCNVSSFSVSSWENVQRLVRAGLHDKYFAVGDQLVCQKGDSNLTWDIIGLDHDVPTDSQFTHSMTLQLHDCLSSTMMVDNQEAIYYAENGLTAGTYNFTIQDSYDTSHGGGKTYQFTLANDVPAKGQLTFSWAGNTQASAAKITSYASSTSTTVIEQVGVTEGSGGTSLGTTDGNSTNVNHIHRARYGSNNYKESAIRQFLNSSAVAGSVWTPQTKYDRPPSWNASTAGFMNDIDSDFLAVLGASPKVVALNTVTDGGGSVTINNDKFFLLSLSEVYGGKENNINEGEPYPYYSNYSDLSAAGTAADTNRIKYRSGTAQPWWLRSPNSANGYGVRNVYSIGVVYNYGDYAQYSYGVAPACVII